LKTHDAWLAGAAVIVLLAAATAPRSGAGDIPGDRIPAAARKEIRSVELEIDRIEAESLILAMRRFSLSTGSACSSGERGPSRVLTAIGVGEAAAMGSIRIGLGKSNTPEHAAMLVDDLKRTVTKLRQISAA